LTQAVDREPATEPRGGLRGRLSRLSHDIYLEIAGVTLVAPAVFLLCILIAGPFMYVVWDSLFAAGSSSPGLSNYRWFFGGADIFPTLKNDLEMTGGSVGLEIAVAIPLALLLNQRIPGRGILRGLATLPWAVPTIAVAAAFLWLADPFYGLFNQLALSLGLLSQPVSVLGQPSLAIWAVTVATAWKGFPLVFIIILSALQSLDPQYLEAAKVDGALWRSQLRHVILPHLRSSIALAAVLSAVFNFSLFDLAYLLTGGGPAGSTTTWPLLLYNQEFGAFDNGRAGVVGVTIFIAGVMSLALVLGWDGLRRRRYYA
jgi:multiple sugar transport system permease protein